ncbi:H-NS histone family protein [Massilia sp. CCM 8692]|uniref:H-NS histone family protein n=1 Tax=Massilia rubra TaxID=2607910 RepID=A0ABX0M0S6_9BURK|nr:H-NS histone family protein [Massilia rubra]
MVFLSIVIVMQTSMLLVSRLIVGDCNPCNQIQTLHRIRVLRCNYDWEKYGLITNVIGATSRLERKVGVLIASRHKKERADAIGQIYAVAHRLGMPLQSLLQGTEGVKVGTMKRRREGTVYQDPINLANTWAGIGPRPKWLKSALAAGVQMDALRA